MQRIRPVGKKSNNCEGTMEHWLEKYRYCPACGSDRFVESSVKSKRCEVCGLEVFMNASASNVAVITRDGDDGRKNLLVVRRAKEPARGTLDLPGGFADADETAEEGVCREVKEETGLTVVRATYLFSEVNRYSYGGLTIPTQDLFFHCEVADFTDLKAMDDAADYQWIALDELHPDQFGLASVRRGVVKILKKIEKTHI